MGSFNPSGVSGLARVLRLLIVSLRWLWWPSLVSSGVLSEGLSQFFPGDIYV